MQTIEGQGKGYFSSAATPVDFNVLQEIMLTGSVYGAGFIGLNALAKKQVGGGYTAFDLVQKQLRNTAAFMPFTFGFLNTFRVPEFMSPYMSTKALGLDVEKSVLNPSKDVGVFNLDSRFFINNEASKIGLRKTIGDEAYERVRLAIDNPLANRDYRLRYEQETDKVGRGKLFFQMFDTSDVEFKNPLNNILISEDVFLIHDIHSADAVDILEEANVTKKINPAAVAIHQGLGTPEALEKAGLSINHMFAEINPVTNETIDRPRFIFGPSIEGDISSFDAIKRRLAYPTSYMNFGFNRFNRLLSATADQVPVIGDFVANIANKTGLTLKTTPGPAYKQFLELGGKASLIGLSYMGLETIDHYRRKFETPGHLAISAGVAAGIGYAYDSLSDSATRSLKPLHVAIGAFATQMLPGFSQGVVPGIATMATSADVGRSYMGLATGMSFYRRGLEGLLPGISSPGIGVLAGLGTLGLAYGMKLGAKRLQEKSPALLPKAVTDRIGFFNVETSEIDPTTGLKKVVNILHDNDLVTKELNIKHHELNTLQEVLFESDSAHFRNLNPIFNEAPDRLKDSKFMQNYFDRLYDFMGVKKGDPFDIHTATNEQKEKIYKVLNNVSDLFAGSGTVAERNAKLLDFEYKFKQLAKTSLYESKTKNNILNYSLLNRVEDIKSKYANNSNFFSFAFEKAEIFATEFYHAFHGASMEGEGFDQYAKQINYKPMFRRAGTLFAGGFLLHSLLTGSLLGTMENPDELKEIYAGRKLVDVKRGRWWEGGGTAYEGGDVEYSRTHGYYNLMQRAEQKALWGEEDDLYNPFTKFFLKNFTYHLEEKHYYDRPYPISGTAFEDVPVLGGLLSGTIGRLIKPAKLMHVNEYMKVNEQNELEYFYPQEVGSQHDIAGTTPSGPPISPYNIGVTAGRVQYQMREIEGLTGYVKNMIQKAVTGRETVGTQYPVFESANKMSSLTESYWDKELGGMMFLSEPLRRLFPRPKKDTEEYNPILNNMPSWLPNKFRKGDPYTKIKSGYARLPGEGYQALFPELKGLDPEAYPMIHKYKILADVAPTSREVIKLRQQLYERRAAELTTDYENKMMDEVTERHRKRLSFEEEQFDENAIRIPGISTLTSSAFYNIKEGIRTAAQPVEYLIPGGFRPVQKTLGGDRNAIDQYEYERLYGTPNAFWDSPVRDWFRPSFYSAMNLMGYEGIPGHVQDKRKLDEQFDKLNFYKYMQLAQNASNGFEKRKMLAMAAKTRQGVNPTGDPMSIYMSLPEEERKFFNSFATAKPEDRERILEMIPEDQKHLYTAVWSSLDSGAPMGNPDAKPTFDESYLYDQYDQLDMTQYPVPKPDWIGWNKDVDINDVKIKYVDSLGTDMRDYDLWESQAKRVRRQNSLVNSHEFMYEPPMSDRGMVSSMLLHSNPYSRLLNDKLVFNTTADYTSRAELLYNDNRQTEIESLIDQYKFGY
jgi:hypothetical protein